MTDTEFSAWAKRLFIAYPSLWEWLQRNSPDHQETQRLWREQLRDYSAEECNAVLDEWQSGTRLPFEAYERDKVVLVVRSVIDKKRDKVRKAREQAERAKYYRETRERNAQAEPVGTSTLLDSEMRQAVIECVPIHRAYLDGEITRENYEAQRDVIIDKLLAPKGEAWQPN